MTEKVWFITGASRGFGREWAIAALDRGDKVAATPPDIDRTEYAHALPTSPTTTLPSHQAPTLTLTSTLAGAQLRSTAATKWPPPRATCPPSTI
ncbi:hypothetical protein [Mycolicibacterium vanbaalenii]|uniref:hypothetical protein n=1 Tax=Mycolicibacterium vanbaalenii TaxID=110539 RepID=UPI003BB01841